MEEKIREMSGLILETERLYLREMARDDFPLL